MGFSEFFRDGDVRHFYFGKRLHEQGIPTLTHSPNRVNDTLGANTTHRHNHDTFVFPPLRCVGDDIVCVSHVRRYVLALGAHCHQCNRVGSMDRLGESWSFQTCKTLQIHITSVKHTVLWLWLSESTLTFSGLRLSEDTFYEFHSTLVRHVDFTATGDFCGLLKDEGK